MKKQLLLSITLTMIGIISIIYGLTHNSINLLNI